MMKIYEMRNLFIIGFVVAYLAVFQASAQNRPKKFGDIRDSFDFKNLEIKDMKELKIHGTEYLAISYLDPLPGGKYESRFSVALLQKKNGKYVRLFEKVVCDIGAPHCSAPPLLFESKDNKFIVFEIFCGGQGSHRCFCIVRVVKDKIKEIPMENYYFNPLIKNLLKPGESTIRGAVYGFEQGEISGRLDIYKEDDGGCCPTGGSLVFLYKFENDAFRIVDAKRGF